MGENKAGEAKKSLLKHPLVVGLLITIVAGVFGVATGYIPIFHKELKPSFKVVRWELLSDSTRLKLTVQSSNEDAQREEAVNLNSDFKAEPEKVRDGDDYQWSFVLPKKFSDSLRSGKKLDVTFAFFDTRGEQTRKIWLADSLLKKEAEAALEEEENTEKESSKENSKKVAGDSNKSEEVATKTIRLYVEPPKAWGSIKEYDTFVNGKKVFSCSSCTTSIYNKEFKVKLSTKLEEITVSLVLKNKTDSVYWKGDLGDKVDVLRDSYSQYE